MVKRIVCAALFVTGLAAPLQSGCSSSSTPLATPDSGPPKTQDSGVVSPETGARDTGPATEASSPDAGPGPAGTQLVASKTATVLLEGVTSDDYAVYVDTGANTLYAAPLGGGAPSMIATVDASVIVAVQGKVVLYWTKVDPNGIGALSVWTKSGGVQALGTRSLTGAGSFAASADSAHVVYFDATNGAQGTANISVGATAGGAKSVLVPSVDLFNQTCSPSLGYAGAYALAAYCLPMGSASDAGVGGYVVSYTGPSWTSTTYSTTATTQLPTDAKGTEILVSDASGLSVYPLAGGAAKLIDASGVGGLFTSTGTSVVYTTGAGALVRSAVSPAAPTTLVASGFANLTALSPDDAWALGNTSTNPTSVATDLYLASAATAGKATALSMMPTATLPASPFTADSTEAIYYTAFDLNVGTLNASPTKGGAAATLGPRVLLTYPTTAAKVVFAQNWSANMATGTVDIAAADTSQAASATVLVSQADAYFALSADKTKVVYTWSVTPGSSSGLWVLPAP
jgi:hypothetical protein